jgi:hypothetical protein
MNNFLSALLGALGGSVVTAAILASVIRHYFIKAIDRHFESVGKRLEANLQLDKQIAAELRKLELTALPAISELVYKAKIGVDSIRKAETILDLTNADVIEACRELTTRLTAYRIYLTEEVFQSLHEYKHLLQDLIVFTDRRTRLDNRKKNLAVELSQEDKEDIQRLAHKVPIVCERVMGLLKKELYDLKEIRPR